MLESGEFKSLRKIAERENIDNSYAAGWSIWPVCLSPDIVAAILENECRTEFFIIVCAEEDRYVHDPATVSAVSTIKAIFAEMKNKGWHEARLVELTDLLFNDENNPQDEFEKEARSNCKTALLLTKR